MLVVVFDPERAELLERVAGLRRRWRIGTRLSRCLTRRVAELEAVPREDSRTSSKPPPSDGPVKPPPKSRRESSGRRAGKQPGTPGFTLAEAGLLGDERCQDALELLVGKQLPSGGWAMEGRYYRGVGAGQGQELVDWGRSSLAA
jgi:hypothetical protein